MSSLNKVMLIGNLGKDPEIRYTDGNIPRLSFSLATTEHYKDKNGQKTEHTEWHNIVMWRTLAENAEKLLKKGTQIYLEGRLQTRQWTDREGQKRNLTEIVADNFQILHRPANSGDNRPDNTGSGNLPF
jgi:single-strand DNA-binding protein